MRLQEPQSGAAKRQGAFDFGTKEIGTRNLRRVAEAETLLVDPASDARSMLQELEGGIDVGRFTFAAVAGTGGQGFFRNKRSRRIYAVSKHGDAYGLSEEIIN